MRILGVVLIVLGAISLIWGGITYTRNRQVLDIGPIQATAEEQRRIPLPPIIGGVLLIAGVALVVAGGRRTTV
ncbi:MAG TPA: hypothetical protein VMM18_00890 [Gemmatimonadaceae bacterium]|nr:hypothetical protein [Gemmatimonadaceae bacterium]